MKFKLKALIFRIFYLLKLIINHFFFHNYSELCMSPSSSYLYFQNYEEIRRYSNSNVKKKF